MKKILVIIGLVAFFFWGLSLGGDFSQGASGIFEEAKDDFESSVTSPDGDYDSKSLVPEENIVNKTAHEIDYFLSDKIKFIFDKLFK